MCYSRKCPYEDYHTGECKIGGVPHEDYTPGAACLDWHKEDDETEEEEDDD